MNVAYVVNLLELQGDTAKLYEQPVLPGLDSLSTPYHEFTSPCGNRVLLQRVCRKDMALSGLSVLNYA